MLAAASEASEAVHSEVPKERKKPTSFFTGTCNSSGRASRSGIGCGLQSMAFVLSEAHLRWPESFRCCSNLALVVKPSKHSKQRQRTG